MEVSENFKVVPLLSIDEIHSAFTLAEKVFMEFEAPHFPRRGTESFLNFLWGDRMREMLDMGNMRVWGCYCGDELLGMMALRGGDHISLAFVRGEFHRRGIGKLLFSEVKKYASKHHALAITVNASDYGIPFYTAMGFVQTDMQTVSDGIIYTPMKNKLSRNIFRFNKRN